MLRLLLVRHAAFDGVGTRLVGRAAGVALSGEGVEQARRLADALAHEPVTAVYTSPLQRARETADIIAAAHRIEPRTCHGFAEVDFGEWTDHTVEELEQHHAWRDFNMLRSLTRIPGGELMLETQTRAVTALLDVARRHDGECVGIVSHGDVIRAVIGHLLGIPMDHLLRLEIAPASWSTIELHGAWPRIICIGRTIV